MSAVERTYIRPRSSMNQKPGRPAGPPAGRSSSVDDEPELAREILAAIGFTEHFEVLWQAVLLHHCRCCITGGQKDLELRSISARFDGELHAVHAAWHNDVGEQQVDFLATAQDIEGLSGGC